MAIYRKRNPKVITLGLQGLKISIRHFSLYSKSPYTVCIAVDWEEQDQEDLISFLTNVANCVIITALRHMGSKVDFYFIYQNRNLKTWFNKY